MVSLSTEKMFFRESDGYEAARRATVWNGLVPDRLPEVIIAAHDVDDVVAAISYARMHGHRVGVRSGGTVGRPIICATAEFCSTSAASITAASMRNT